MEYYRCSFYILATVRGLVLLIPSIRKMFSNLDWVSGSPCPLCFTAFFSFQHFSFSHDSFVCQLPWTPSLSRTFFICLKSAFWIFALPLLTCLFIYRGTVRECLGRISASSFCFNILSIISYCLVSALQKSVRTSSLMTAPSGSCQTVLSCVICLCFLVKQEDDLSLAGYWVCNTLKCSLWIHKKWKYYPKIWKSTVSTLASSKITHTHKSQRIRKEISVKCGVSREIQRVMRGGGLKKYRGEK